MKLKSLELQGFKSFPDKTRLDFGEGITAVVGPNGSGKSNISDAMRWVLGEQSTKSLRGSKMEDVIFVGASSRRAQGYAEVSLTLDNTDRAVNFDSDEICVTRRYYRSGESEYRINKAVVRLRDIHEMFMDTGLGRDGYSIISQGKIADIVASKSNDRREIFEEAAGISKYRYRKTDAEKRLSDAQENMLRLKDILKELESQVEPLKIQSEKAKQFLVLAEEKREIEIGLWLNIIESSRVALREQEKRLMIVQNQHKDAENELNDIETQMENIRQSIQHITAGIDDLRRKQSLCEEQSADIKGKADVLENTIYHNEQSIIRLKKDIDEALQSGGQTNEQIELKQKELIQLNNKYKSAEDRLKLVNEEIENIKSGSQGQIKEHDRLSIALMEENDKLSQLSMNKAAAVSSADEIDKRIQSIINDKEQFNENLLKLQNEYKTMQDELSDSKERINDKENWVKGYEMKLLSRQDKLNDAKKLSDKLNLDINDHTRRIAMLEQLDRDMEGFARSVKLIMKQSGYGVLTGIHGPVSKLIKTDGKYALAIETAMGASMQHIVVSSENDAKAAINFLKKQEGGRATFLPMTSIKGNILNESGLDDCWGFIGLAVDLVKYDKQYENIFRSLLGRIVIAEDLDSAVVIAKKYSYRFRIVTLDGQVVNAGGSMTGGSSSKNTGILSRTAQIEKLRAELNKLKEKYELALNEQRRLQNEYNEVNGKLSGAKGELNTEQEDKLRIELELKSIANQMDSLKSYIASSENTIGDLSSRKDEIAAEKEKINIQIVETEQNITELHQKIQLIAGKQEEISEKSRILSEKNSEIKLEMVSLQKDIEASESVITQLKELYENYTGRLSALKQEKLDIENNNIELKQQADQLRGQAEELKIQAKNCLDKIEQSGQERETLEAKYQQMRLFERDKTIERENIGRELVRIEERRAAVQKEYDEAVKKLWDEYELTRSEAQAQSQPAENPIQSQRRLNELKAKIKALGSVNVGAIEQYKEVSERYEFMSKQLSDVEQSCERLHKLIAELTGKMKEIFIDRFGQINKNFAEIFAELFGGGSASLSLSDENDILSSGIDINVHPPGKIINNLDSLSGGEKSFVSIALYFAILKVNPSPFCVLDEIEAALDDVNVDRYAAYLKKLCSNTQFIVITHRHGTMEAADILYGVTMQEQGVSKLLKLNLSEVSQKLGI